MLWDNKTMFSQDKNNCNVTYEDYTKNQINKADTF